MWSALRSDFREFVSTVTEETAQVLSKLDPDDDDDNNNENYYKAYHDEAMRRISVPETFTTPLEEEVEIHPTVTEFVQQFSIQDKTEEIAQELESNDILQQQFEALVPTMVSYQDFWMRYYWRCSLERIQQEQQQEQDDDDDEEEVRALDMPPSKSIPTGVRKLWGGAVHAVSATLSEDDDGNPMNQPTMSFFGASGRPPFVMNTAVDEDDEDDGIEDEGDEEELGWGDDDDDEDEEDQNEADETSEQIEFRDAATEQLQEQLKQALEERDLLHQTVEMQSQKIASLMAGQEAPAEEIISELKMKVFEKESELAAVKESLYDRSRESSGFAEEDREASAALEAEKEAAVQSLVAKEEELKVVLASLERAEVALQETSIGAASNTRELEEALAKNSDLQSRFEALTAKVDALEAEKALNDSKIDQLEEIVASLKAEIESLRWSLDGSRGGAGAQLAEAQAELATSRQEMSALAAQLSEATANATASGERATKLHLELQDTRQKLRELETHSPKPADQAVSDADAGSPDTASTGVKVETPKAVKLSKENGDEEEDWGDDW